MALATRALYSNECSILVCVFFKPLTSEKLKGQLGHSKGFSFLWTVATCFFKWSIRPKSFGHHRNSESYLIFKLNGIKRLWRRAPHQFSATWLVAFLYSEMCFCSVYVVTKVFSTTPQAKLSEITYKRKGKTFWVLTKDSVFVF